MEEKSLQCVSGCQTLGTMEAQTRTYICVYTRGARGVGLCSVSEGAEKKRTVHSFFSLIPPGAGG